MADEIAPEHLHIATENAEELAEKIRHAGAMFLGNYTPVALGDYAAGPSHVLPTSGTARFASGLSANDFLRANSILHFSQRRHDAAGPRRASAGHQGRADRTSGERGSKNEGGRRKGEGGRLKVVSRADCSISTVHFITVI